jgi:hypothetical protein
MAAETLRAELSLREDIFGPGITGKYGSVLEKRWNGPVQSDYKEGGMLVAPTVWLHTLVAIPRERHPLLHLRPGRFLRLSSYRWPD